jgi:hypothetical protein
VHIATGQPERGVVLPDGLLVRPFEQAVNLAVGVVVQLDLMHAEIVGPLMAGIVGDLRDGLGGQLQIAARITPSGGVPGDIQRTGLLSHRAVSMVRASLERRWNSADTPGAA